MNGQKRARLERLADKDKLVDKLLKKHRFPFDDDYRKLVKDAIRAGREAEREKTKKKYLKRVGKAPKCSSDEYKEFAVLCGLEDAEEREAKAKLEGKDIRINIGATGADTEVLVDGKPIRDMVTHITITIDPASPTKLSMDLMKIE